DAPDQARTVRPLPAGPPHDAEGHALRPEPGGPAQDRRRPAAGRRPPRQEAPL
ncbi:MAG: hypothetical protein AVDCRST_MAG45-611, partial [uncultured Solirubrobacterales bacterium]